jgi:hypothetical protein
MELKGTRLSGILNSEIEAQADDDTSEADIKAQMARASGISGDTLARILRAEINCPPLRRLEGFAEVLKVSMSRLRSAAESDGCEYGSDGKALHCCLMPSTKSIVDDLRKMTESLKTD